AVRRGVRHRRSTTPGVPEWRGPARPVHRLEPCRIVGGPPGFGCGRKLAGSHARTDTSARRARPFPWRQPGARSVELPVSRLARPGTCRYISLSVAHDEHADSEREHACDEDPEADLRHRDGNRMMPGSSRYRHAHTKRLRYMPNPTTTAPP